MPSLHVGVLGPAVRRREDIEELPHAIPAELLDPAQKRVAEEPAGMWEDMNERPSSMPDEP